MSPNLPTALLETADMSQRGVYGEQHDKSPNNEVSVRERSCSVLVQLQIKTNRMETLDLLRKHLEMNCETL